jgi:hypothetical protein
MARFTAEEERNLKNLAAGIRGQTDEGTERLDVEHLTLFRRICSDCSLTG